MFLTAAGDSLLPGFVAASLAAVADQLDINQQCAPRCSRSFLLVHFKVMSYQPSNEPYALTAAALVGGGFIALGWRL